MQTWELTAHGRVQGVGFRWHAWHCAKKHSILGYVRNQPDGTVLVIAQADMSVLEFFAMDLQHGHGPALVSRLDRVIIDTTKRYNDFEIR
ncbi:MAG: acylphosphatase [Candidatus Cloacimonadota bacterium]